MKKLLLIAATLTTMVSCSKTQVIPEETQQQEIAMKAYNQAAVKATGPISGTEFGNDYNAELMRIYGFYSSDASSYSPYLTADFKYQTVESETAWMGWSGSAHKAYYWPSTGSMKFIAVFPIDYEDYEVTVGTETTAGSISYDNTENETTISQIDLSDFTKQKDLVYSDNLYSRPVSCSYTTAKQALTFKHLLSQVVVNVKSTVAGVVKLKSVVLDDAEVKGSINIPSSGGVPKYTYPSGTSTGDVTYTLSSSYSTTYVGTASFTSVSDKGALVLPSNRTNSTKLVVTYSIDEGADITHSILLSEVWAAGKKYVYNVEINLNEIKFSATVADWVTDLNTNSTADDDIEKDI